MIRRRDLVRREQVAKLIEEAVEGGRELVAQVCGRDPGVGLVESRVEGSLELGEEFGRGGAVFLGGSGGGKDVGEAALNRGVEGRGLFIDRVLDALLGASGEFLVEVDAKAEVGDGAEMAGFELVEQAAGSRTAVGCDP
jgi:hypothetical protein